ncbi:MAG: hypothetical protein ACR2QB_08370 [Gammaproteobacteria bacterium]
MNLRKLVLASAVAAAFGAPGTAVADSELTIGPTGSQAAADVIFTITIPDFIYFQVGTPGNGNVDTVTFDMTGVESGDGLTPVAGDVSLNVVLRSNADVSIGANNPGLTSPSGTIPTTEITASDLGNIAVPDFGVTNNLPAGPYNLTDTWSYSYDNTAVYAPDTYTGTVTYTVTTLP